MLDVLNVICEKIEEILIASAEEIKVLFTGDFADDCTIMNNVGDKIIENVIDVYGGKYSVTYDNYATYTHKFHITVKVSDEVKSCEKNIVINID